MSKIDESVRVKASIGPSVAPPRQLSGAIYGGTATALTETPTHLQNGTTAITSQAKESASNTNWSTSLQAVLDQPPSSLPGRLLLGGLCFCLAFGAWAIFGQIDEVGHARGRLIPKGEPYKINPVVAGKVVHIDVREGQAVKAGQSLFELDSQLAAVEVERLQQEHLSYQTELLQTQASIDKTRLEAQTRAAIANAEAQVVTVAIAQAKSKVMSQEAESTETKVKAATSQVLLNQFQVDVAAHQERLARLRPLVEVGAIGKEQMFQAEEALREKQRSINQSQGEIQQTLAQLTRLQAERQQALDEPSRLQAERNEKQAEGHAAQIESQQKIQQLEVQKTQLQAKIAQNEKLLAKAKAELKQLSLIAPVEGVVLSLNVRNSGEVVREGQTIAEIAPRNAPLILSATLLNQEAGFVKTGMPVQIKLDAYPYQDYGIVNGKVITISPDSKPDERQGAVYRVEVALDRNYVMAHHQTIRFKAGQTAVAEIVIRRRRIADILLDPIRQMQKGRSQFIEPN